MPELQQQQNAVLHQAEGFVAPGISDKYDARQQNAVDATIS